MSCLANIGTITVTTISERWSWKNSLYDQLTYTDAYETTEVITNTHVQGAQMLCIYSLIQSALFSFSFSNGLWSGWKKVCPRVSPPVGLYTWAGQSVRRLERAASFSFFIFEVSKLCGSNDFITAGRDGGGLYVERWRCACVWGGLGAESV